MRAGHEACLEYIYISHRVSGLSTCISCFSTGNCGPQNPLAHVPTHLRACCFVSESDGRALAIETLSPGSGTDVPPEFPCLIVERCSQSKPGERPLLHFNPRRRGERRPRVEDARGGGEREGSDEEFGAADIQVGLGEMEDDWGCGSPDVALGGGAESVDFRERDGMEAEEMAHSGVYGKDVDKYLVIDSREECCIAQHPKK